LYEWGERGKAGGAEKGETVEKAKGEEV